MHEDKQPERRTFLQERFEILIKRQREGTATFNQLTELDEIVNRDPELRERVFRENILMEDFSDLNSPETGSEPDAIKPQYRSVLGRITTFLQRVVNLKFSLTTDTEARAPKVWYLV